MKQCSGPPGGIKQILDSQAFELAFLFLLFQRTCSSLSGFPDDLCASYGVVWIYGSWNHLFQSPSYLMALLGGDPSWDWISVRWYSRARYPSGAHLNGLWRWSGAVVLDNCETDARTQFRMSTPTQRTSVLGFPIGIPSSGLVATWLILPVVICLS